MDRVKQQVEVLRVTSDGWRGIIAEHITGAFVREIASRIGSSFRPGKVVVGFDTRFQADYLAREAAQVFHAHGHEVLLSDRPIPTPVLSWCVRKYSAEIGFQVTASHNPPEYAGVKLRLRDGIAPSAEDLKQFQSIELSVAPRDEGGINQLDLISSYVAEIRSQINLDKISVHFPRVAVDSMHGTTANLLKQIAQDKFEIVGVREQRDPLFGGVAPDPKSSNLTPLADAVRQSYSSIGFAHDGDGDRIAAWDPDRGFVSPQDIISILALHLCKTSPGGGLAASVTTTSRIRRIAEQYGRPFYETEVGFHNSSVLLRDGKVMLAGEENGGVALSSFGSDRDGTVAALVLLEALATSNAGIPDALAEVAGIAGEVVFTRMDVPLEPGKSIDFPALLSEALGLPSSSTSAVKKGAKAFLPDGAWIVARSSGTEPLLRLYAESPTSDRTDQIIQTVLQGVRRQHG